MILKAVHFTNFRALRETRLDLGRFTVIVGPNGSGKSTALQALAFRGGAKPMNLATIASVGCRENEETRLTYYWEEEDTKQNRTTFLSWNVRKDGVARPKQDERGTPKHQDYLGRARLYSLEAKKISAPVSLKPNIELQEDGFGLAGVLDQMRDRDPERFQWANEALTKWIPEFDQILFETLVSGQRSFGLRVKDGKYKISAEELSNGTLLALAMLTIAYLPDPPSIVCFEEPDSGIHPRLLRDVRDTLYRLSHPAAAGEIRNAVQVVITTHSPYLLDLFRDHSDEVILAQKNGTSASFEKLSERKDIEEILADAQLGEAWYSGILGGTPGR